MSKSETWFEGVLDDWVGSDKRHYTPPLMIGVDSAYERGEVYENIRENCDVHHLTDVEEVGRGTLLNVIVLCSDLSTLKEMDGVTSVELDGYVDWWSDGDEL